MCRNMLCDYLRGKYLKVGGIIEVSEIYLKNSKKTGVLVMRMRLFECWENDSKELV